VCLLSPHPLVLDELKGAFPHPEFTVTTMQFDPVPAENVEKLAPPPAKVFVLDGQGLRPEVERLAPTLLRIQPGCSVLVLENRFTEASAFPLLRAGARGLIDYDHAREQLPIATRALAGGGYWVPRTLLGRFVDVLLTGGAGTRGGGGSGLSPRERQVLDALLENLSSKEIGSKLNISERTVKFHVSSILEKYKVRRRADLILRFYQEKGSL
jgi:DNA-binding NarL/FixJ family response regulator